MFDIGFWEIAVIGVIALLVIGPERLPAVARNVGRWVGQVRRYVSHVKQDIEREIHADEVRDLLENPDGLASIRDVARETADVFDETRKELHDVAANINSTSSPEIAPDGSNAPNAPNAPGQAGKEATPMDSTSVSESAGDSPTSPADGSDSAASTSTADEQRTGQPGQH